MIFFLKNIDDVGFGFWEGLKLESFFNWKLVVDYFEINNELVNVWGSCGYVFVVINVG